MAFQIPNGGEVAGYKKQWLSRPTVSKSTMNKMSAPTATLKKKIPLKGSLNLPSMLFAWANDEWQEWLDFAEVNYFFIRESDFVDGNTKTADQSYLCYDLKNVKGTTHAATRSLVNLSASFQVFNGL